MALNERLQILVTADGKGAVSEFQKIGATAERELGRTDDRIARLSSGLISNGTQVALAGGIATAGVFALAKAAGDYEEAASAAGIIFGDSAEAIEEFGKKAIDTAGLSRRAAVEASNTFGTFGKAAGLAGPDLAEFSTELTQLAGDLASFKNTTTDEAITAIGAALRGESEPIRQYGVLLDDATLKQEALSLGIYDGNGALTQQQKVLAAQSAIFKQTTDAQGDYLRTSDSLSNQTRSFTAEIENLKVGLGEGAVPVFSELVGATNDALSAFQNLSPETQNLVGQIGAIGALGATAAGGIAVLGGYVLKLKELAGASALLSGTLSAGVPILAAFGITAVASSVINDLTGNTDRLNESMKDLGDTLANEKPALDSFFDAAKTQNLSANPYTLLVQLFEDVARGSATLADGTTADFRTIERVINDTAESGSGSLIELQHQLEDERSRLDVNSEAWKDYGTIIDIVRQKRREIAPPDLGKGTGAAIAGVQQEAEGATVSVDEFGNAVSDAADETSAFASDLDDTNKLLKLSKDLFDLTADRVGNYMDRIEASSKLDDFIDAQLNLRDASKELLDGLGALNGADIASFAAGAKDVSDEAAAALGDVAAAGEAAQQQIANTLQMYGSEAAIKKADSLREGFTELFDAADLTDRQITDLLTAMGLLPDQVNTAITLSGADEAIAKLQLLRDFLENPDGTSGIPAEVETQLTIAISEGRFVDAANLLQLWIDDVQDDLITNPILLALGVANADEVTETLRNIAGEPGTPNEIKIQVAIALSEDRLTDAQNLLNLWKQDASDGTIEDPLLVAMGLGDTKPASDDVEQWKQDEEKKRPANVPVGADTGPGRESVGKFVGDIQSLRPLIQVGIQFSGDAGAAVGDAVGDGARRFGNSLKARLMLGGADGDPATPYPRAAGGPVNADNLYSVNEPSLGGELFRPSTDGFVMNAGDTDRLIKGVEALVNGSSNMTVNQTITAPDPVTAGSESVRKFRDAQHLAA